MSPVDRPVMQSHLGCFRKDNAQVFARYERDEVADVRIQTEYADPQPRGSTASATSVRSLAPHVRRRALPQRAAT
jgi:hypothetical protein